MLSAKAETSHDPIGPCGPLEQSVDSSRHSLIAYWSSPLDCGAHAVWGVITAVRWLRLAYELVCDEHQVAVEVQFSANKASEWDWHQSRDTVCDV